VNSGIRTLMVGCGGISRAWLEVIKDIPSIEMVGFVDLNEEVAREKASTYNWNDAYITENLDDALSQLQPEAVFNCTVPEAHYDVTLKALEYGCHVLGEKPMADTMFNAT
jgi:predicted dehydrogenase